MRTAIEKRMLWQILSLILLILTIYSLPAFAGDLNPGAPPAPTMKTLDQIPPTWDQVLPASERFKLVMGGAAVLDRETGLVWEQSPSTGTYTYDWSGSNAAFQCNGMTVGGRKWWRLPTLQELASLVDTSVLGSPKLPSGHPFSNVQSSSYVSTTEFAFATRVWVVDFSIGNVDPLYGTSSALYVWCVRGGQGPDIQ